MQAAVLIATLLAAGTNWWSRIADNETVEQWSKPLTTVLVIGVALVSGAPHSHVAIAVLALVLCLMGDIALMPVVDNFVAGLAAFLLGHVVFIALFVRYGLPHPALAGVALLFGAVVAGTVGRVIVAGATHQDHALRIPVLAYLTVILSMSAFGWATGNWWVIVGSVLFVISDSVLGWRQFVHDRSWMGLAVMVTYHGAIASLALSLW